MFKLLFRQLCKLSFQLTGWKITGREPHYLGKFVIAVAPHTSWKDFPLGIAVRSVYKLEYLKFLVKKEAFKFPFGSLLRAMGGYSVDRSKRTNMVDQMVAAFNNHDRFAIALAPEGTRKKVSRLKSGFYHIAKKAGIPIVFVSFDFKKKEVAFSEPFYPTEDMEKDMAFIWDYFSGVTGAKPELGVH